MGQKNYKNCGPTAAIYPVWGPCWSQRSGRSVRWWQECKVRYETKPYTFTEQRSDIETFSGFSKDVPLCLSKSPQRTTNFFSSSTTCQLFGQVTSTFCEFYVFPILQLSSYSGCYPPFVGNRSIETRLSARQLTTASPLSAHHVSSANPGSLWWPWARPPARCPTAYEWEW